VLVSEVLAAMKLTSAFLVISALVSCVVAAPIDVDVVESILKPTQDEAIAESAVHELSVPAPVAPVLDSVKLSNIETASTEEIKQAPVVHDDPPECCMLEAAASEIVPAFVEAPIEVPQTPLEVVEVPLKGAEAPVEVVKAPVEGTVDTVVEKSPALLNADVVPDSVSSAASLPTTLSIDNVAQAPVDDVVKSVIPVEEAPVISTLADTVSETADDATKKEGRLLTSSGKETAKESVEASPLLLHAVDGDLMATESLSAKTLAAPVVDQAAAVTAVVENTNPSSILEAAGYSPEANDNSKESSEISSLSGIEQDNIPIVKSKKIDRHTYQNHLAALLFQQDGVAQALEMGASPQQISMAMLDRCRTTMQQMVAAARAARARARAA